MWCGLLVHLPSSTTSRAPAKGPVRIESCPPSPFDHSQGKIDRLFDRLLDWLGEGFDRRSRHEASDSMPPAGVTPLSPVCLEFIAALEDIPTRGAADLAVRIRRARS